MQYFKMTRSSIIALAAAVSFSQLLFPASAQRAPASVKLLSLEKGEVVTVKLKSAQDDFKFVPSGTITIEEFRSMRPFTNWPNRSTGLLESSESKILPRKKIISFREPDLMPPVPQSTPARGLDMHLLDTGSGAQVPSDVISP